MRGAKSRSGCKWPYVPWLILLSSYRKMLHGTVLKILIFVLLYMNLLQEELWIKFIFSAVLLFTYGFTRRGEGFIHAYTHRCSPVPLKGCSGHSVLYCLILAHLSYCSHLDLFSSLLIVLRLRLSICEWQNSYAVCLVVDAVQDKCSQVLFSQMEALWSNSYILQTNKLL